MPADGGRYYTESIRSNIRPETGLDESDFLVAEIEGLAVAYVDIEPPAPADGPPSQPEPPLVLVHGFTGHRDDWIGVLPRLAERRRVVAFDLPGHGDSASWPEQAEYSLAHHVRLLRSLLDRLEIRRCDLLGHSVGGMIALRFALSEADRLRSLILMSTAPEVPSGLSRAAFEKACAIVTARGLDFLQALTEKAGRAAGDPILDLWRERYWAHHRRRLGAMSASSYVGLGTALFDSDSLVASLPFLRLPTLVLVGAHDHEFLPGAALFESLLPNARRATIAEAGHHPHQENPDAWRAALEAHLRSLSPELGCS